MKDISINLRCLVWQAYFTFLRTCTRKKQTLLFCRDADSVLKNSEFNTSKQGALLNFWLYSYISCMLMESTSSSPVHCFVGLSSMLRWKLSFKRAPRKPRPVSTLATTLQQREALQIFKYTCWSLYSKRITLKNLLNM